MATTKKRSRQSRALTTLEAQLKSGVKILKDSLTKQKLSDFDIKRINAEMSVLKLSLSKG